MSTDALAGTAAMTLTPAPATLHDRPGIPFRPDAARAPFEPSAPGAAAGGDFERWLNRAMGDAGDTDARRQRVEESARMLVSSAFVLPALAALRDSPFLQDGPFAPGAAERRFGPLLDQHIADDITSSAHFPLVDAIVKKYAHLIDLEPAGAPRRA